MAILTFPKYPFKRLVAFFLQVYGYIPPLDSINLNFILLLKSHIILFFITFPHQSRHQFFTLDISLPLA